MSRTNCRPGSACSFQPGSKFAGFERLDPSMSRRRYSLYSSNTGYSDGPWPSYLSAICSRSCRRSYGAKLVPWKKRRLPARTPTTTSPPSAIPTVRRHIPTAAAPTKPSVRMNGAVTVIALKSDQVADARAT